MRFKETYKKLSNKNKALIDYVIAKAVYESYIEHEKNHKIGNFIAEVA